MQDKVIQDGDKMLVACKYDDAICMEHAEAVRRFGNGFSSCRDVRHLAAIPLPEFLRMSQEAQGQGQESLNERVLRWVVDKKRSLLTVPRLNVRHMIRPKREI